MLNKYTIKMYNVGFGDAFLLFNDDFSLILDCGSRNANVIKNNLPAIISDMERSFVYGKSNIVISHFHTDHTNGIGNCNSNSVDEVFVPDYFSEDEIRLQLYVLLFLSSKSWAYRYALYLLTTVPHLIRKRIVKPQGLFSYVKRGTQIIDGRFDVLWPDLDRYSSEAKELIDGIESLNKVWFDSEDNSKTVEDFIENYISVLSNPVDKEIVQNREAENWAEVIISKVNALIESKSFNRIASKKISDHQNRICMVLRGHYSEDQNDLFLADVDKHTWKTIIAPDVNEIFRLVKVSHHGTKSYFMENLPVSEGIMISNGKYSNWYLYSGYPLKYYDKRIYCTDNSGCELYSFRNQTCDKAVVGLSSSKCGFAVGNHCLIP